jgi:hypothetical protein
MFTNRAPAYVGCCGGWGMQHAFYNCAPNVAMQWKTCNASRRQHGQPDAGLLRSIMRHGRQRAHVADASRPHQPSASIALLSDARHNSGNTAVAVRDLPPPPPTPPPPPRWRVGSAAGRRGTNTGVAAGAERAVRLGLGCAKRRPIASRLSISAVSVGFPCARAG